MSKDKVEMRPKVKKQPKKPMDFSWVGRFVDKLAMAIAYLLLFVSATYGIRMFLNTIPDWANYGITSFLVLSMVYIIFRAKK